MRPSLARSRAAPRLQPKYKIPGARSYTRRTLALPGMVTVTPLADVTSRPVVSTQLSDMDEVIARYTTASYFNDFPKQARRGMLFTKTDDVDMAAVFAAANLYDVSVMHYNLEWPAHTWDQIRDQLEITRNALLALGDTRPLIFGPIKTFLDTHIAAYAPFCDGFAWQLQLSPTLAQVPGFVTESVAASHGVKPNCPVYIQMNAYSESESAISYYARIVSGIAGVTEVNLYFGGAVNWTKAWNVLCRLRPTN